MFTGRGSPVTRYHTSQYCVYRPHLLRTAIGLVSDAEGLSQRHRSQGHNSEQFRGFPGNSQDPLETDCIVIYRGPAHWTSADSWR